MMISPLHNFESDLSPKERRELRELARRMSKHKETCAKNRRKRKNKNKKKKKK